MRDLWNEEETDDLEFIAFDTSGNKYFQSSLTNPKK